jgi:flagellar hook-basal body complex protein FliE
VDFLSIQPIMPITSLTESKSVDNIVNNGAKSFQDILNNALQSVNNLQNDAADKAVQVAMGDASSFHEAVIASEKASLALQLTAQVESKVVDAYNQVMHMQI